MEALPCEMVLKISKHLTVKDLARCCRVSKGWRAAFNQDRLWKPHCDSDLEEHLRTTPATVEPVFVIPVVEDSTLTPICRWRLAFLREKHLKSNWKHNNRRTKSLFELKNELHTEFLTNTLVVRWFPKYFEVWDVSGDPTMYVANTDPSVGDIDDFIDRFLEGNLIVIRQISHVKVFFVDVINKIVDLKFVILLYDVIDEPAVSDYIRELETCPRFARPCKRFSSGMDSVKANVLVHVSASRLKLDIFNLETGIKIKEEPCPQVDIDGTKSEVLRVSTSRTSDYVVVVVKLKPDNGKCYYYIYSPQRLGFVGGCFAQVTADARRPDYGEIHHRYFAISYNRGCDCTVYDCLSHKVILTRDFVPKIGFYRHGSNNNFLFRNTSLEKVVLPNGTLKVVKRPRVKCTGKYTVFMNKLLAFSCSDLKFRWYLLLDNVWVKCDFRFEEKAIINQALTKVVSPKSRCAPEEMREGWWYIYHYW